ncbi:precorrin-6y C5,15-methyltransferase (decarboxylating) subunit CbiE [Sulfitobacter sp. D35]|uniref:precorrin-6y C5,15-methyltransferase (decarboxylating) subunit CbiE n=1 Tax=Sulfitobacter sp. D35 TaxID=3083252 RepID=UPI00296F843A|nr:precorrin-6y C5,15-methyltransferase (decarboxylating) subunit CbiE [Sulfitobacter sp. D35]MDW4496476.1 precorrin-6y C5,15-methyltransferase (decarboxylating) subunit CbiE [Sulfitobacter sp. D35]
MAEAPWLTLVGLGEDGPEGLSPASLAALGSAEIVIGPKRHLALVGPLEAETHEWPVPFADGLPRLLALRGRKVVVLVSGDPFWHGAGCTITKDLQPGEWRALPVPGCFSLAAARLGLALQDVTCLALHAAPYDRLRPHLGPGARLIVTLRDGRAVPDLAAYLVDAGFADSRVTVMESLGGPQERLEDFIARDQFAREFSHPVCAAIDVRGSGAVLQCCSGIADDFFDTDGQITKRPVRALTLSALAPRPRERLWDIGGGSGSIAIEWLLSDPTTQAVCVEVRADRAERIAGNAARLGVDRLAIVEGAAPEALTDLPDPDAVFIGGGLSEALLEVLFDRLPPGTRLVANAVTLESEALLARSQSARGGTLLRIELSEAAPLGSRTGWRAAYPVVQWSVTT